nr:MAG TPA: hypothetical protein [Bacteriophage sp.]
MICTPLASVVSGVFFVSGWYSSGLGHYKIGDTFRVCGKFRLPPQFRVRSNYQIVANK